MKPIGHPMRIIPNPGGFPSSGWLLFCILFFLLMVLA